jgi:hypothetical protein
VGFVFQFYNLIPSPTAREDMALVTDIATNPLDPDEALGLVGLKTRLDHFPGRRIRTRGARGHLECGHGLFSVFPFVGAWIVWAPAAAVLTIPNRPWDAGLLVAIGLAAVPVDNLIRPAIVARATKLNRLLVLIGLPGGVQAFGVT